MERSNDSSQPQDIHSRLKRSHDITDMTQSTDVLRREKRRRTDNGQEGQGCADANTRTDGSHARHRVVQLDMSVVGRERPEPVIENAATRGYHTQAPAQVHNASHAWPPRAAVPADVMQSNNMFQNAQRVQISGNSNFHNVGSVTNVYGGGIDGLQNLNGFISFEAQFDSSAQDPDRQCHPGTRQNVLKRLRDWIDDPNSTERIFWLYGPAGAGKSAIAQTIAHAYDRQKIAGTFFFFRSDVNRNDGNRLFTTLAYQLALSMPDIKDRIADSLYERPDLPKTGVEAQFSQLFVRLFHVLSEDATQQLGPAVVVDILKKFQDLAPVIIIDGVDECVDENLQRRFLKVIGDAVPDDRFPLRFLIVSRPELHIEQTIRRFQTPILTIDLAKLEDANQDIEKHLVAEFSRIASEQGLDQTWPGQEIIDDIVYKSSGNFIFASLVIRFVGDPYSFAKTQLDIVLNIKPPKTMSPFAILDQLFLEILRRVPDQDFLTKYLALLTARISVSNGINDLDKDDAVIMHVSEEELHANLRRMRSLFKFKPRIDLHHKSFLDFLQDSSRSGQYYTGKPGGIMRYLELFVDSLVRYTSTAIEQPDRHNVPHFTPRFRAMITVFPLMVKLCIIENVMQPLLDLQDNFLQLRNFPSTHPLLCDVCTIFRLLRELLCMGLNQAVLYPYSRPSFESGMDIRKRTSVISSTTTKKKTNYNDLDSVLLSLFVHLPEIKENWLPTKKVIKLVSAILRFDHTETARSVCFVSDAQKLMDLLNYLIEEKDILCRIDPDGAREAAMLALEIFSRVPVFPQSFSFHGIHESGHNGWTYAPVHIEILAQTLFASWILDRRYIVPMLAINDGSLLVSCFRSLNGISMNEWRKRIIPSSMTTIQIMLGLAKAIQYFHSMGVVLYHRFSSHAVFLDSDLRPKIFCLFSTSRSLLDNQYKGWFLREHNIFSFGYIFYELYSGVDASLFPMEDTQSVVPTRPSVPEIPQFVWQLIQCCCAEDPQERPSIDAVVQEMKSWSIE